MAGADALQLLYRLYAAEIYTLPVLLSWKSSRRNAFSNGITAHATPVAAHDTRADAIY